MLELSQPRHKRDGDPWKRGSGSTTEGWYHVSNIVLGPCLCLQKGAGGLERVWEQ